MRPNCVEHICVEYIKSKFLSNVTLDTSTKKLASTNEVCGSARISQSEALLSGAAAAAAHRRKVYHVFSL
jgi:hypothetical protein